MLEYSLLLNCPLQSVQFFSFFFFKCAIRKYFARICCVQSYSMCTACENIKISLVENIRNFDQQPSGACVLKSFSKLKREVNFKSRVLPFPSSDPPHLRIQSRNGERRRRDRQEVTGTRRIQITSIPVRHLRRRRCTKGD